MKRLVIAAAALGLPAPAFGASYKIVLDRPANGRLLLRRRPPGGGRADPGILVRVIAPGNAVEQRGTVRVLVMNLGNRTFTFGPDQVMLRLGDGTVLRPVPVDQYEQRKLVAEQTANRARTLDMRNRADLSALAGETGSGAASLRGGTWSAPARAGPRPQDNASDDSQLPHAEVLNAIYQLLIPLDVEPQHAWGGYYVFDVSEGRSEAPRRPAAEITVRTGPEEHRFSGMLRWK